MFYRGKGEIAPKRRVKKLDERRLDVAERS